MGLYCLDNFVGLFDEENQAPLSEPLVLLCLGNCSITFMQNEKNFFVVLVIVQCYDSFIFAK